MKRNDIIATTKRVLDLIDTKTLECAPSPQRLASDMFVERERFDKDRELFRRSPHVVAYACEIELGHYITRKIAGVPVLLVRDDEGVLRAFLNACAHRGACVAHGAGEAHRFKCSYHAWCYDQTGRLVGRPGAIHFVGIDETTLGLKELPVCETTGLVVVGLQGDVEVDAHLASITSALAYSFGDYQHLETREFTVNANWKLTVDVNFEGYHFPFLHKNSLHPIAMGHASYDLFEDHCRWAFPLRSIDELRNLPEEQWPDRFEGTVVHFLFPSCVLVETPTTSQMIRIYPGSHAGESIVQLSYMVIGPASEDERAFHLEGAQFASDLLRDEDFVAAAECQQGLEAGRDSVVAGSNEPLLQHLHRVWNKAIGI